MSRLAAAAALAIAAFSASCSNAPPAMVPSPIVMQDERLDFARVVLPERRTTEISVLFATTRTLAMRCALPSRFDELTREDLETLANNERLVGIDVTGVYGPHELGGSRGHGYWVANQRVSSDVLLSMVYPFDPAWRGLVHGPGVSMWTFPDDYPRRVGDAVYQTVPELRREGY
jgi:hypothetical protein